MRLAILSVVTIVLAASYITRSGLCWSELRWLDAEEHCRRAVETNGGFCAVDQIERSLTQYTVYLHVSGQIGDSKFQNQIARDACGGPLRVR